MKLFERLNLSPSIASLSCAEALIQRYCAQHCSSQELQQRLSLVTEEALVNIINYGCSDGLQHRIEFSLHADQQRLQLQFEDDTPAFDPTRQPEARLGLPVSEAPVGGLGIALIKRLSDDWHYQRREGCNILALWFNITSDTALD